MCQPPVCPLDIPRLEFDYYAECISLMPQISKDEEKICDTHCEYPHILRKINEAYSDFAFFFANSPDV